jgi:hypothetical protein
MEPMYKNDYQKLKFKTRIMIREKLRMENLG